MKTINRFWLFIYSTPNIVGSVLGLAGLLLFFAGLIKSFWFLIVAGLYLAGYIGCPRNDQISLKMKNDLQVDLIEVELNKLITSIKKRVLPEILTRVQNISDLVSELLPAVKDDPQNRHVLVQTATDYLPSMLEHYLNLPTTFARFHPLKNGKTPRQILEEQLALLEEQLQIMSRDIHVGDVEALLTHGRFLKKKFHQNKYWEL